MKLNETLLNFDCTSIYCVDSSDDDFLNWSIQPVNTPTLCESDGFFLLKGFVIREAKRVEPCFLDLVMPERISDFVYVREGPSVTRCYHHELTGANVVPAVAVEGFGNYELFYSKIDPEVGIDVLRKGLALAGNKSVIAEDLGYILRDENRPEEAIEAFTGAIQNGPSTEFIFIERARLLDATGRNAEAEADWIALERG